MSNSCASLYRISWHITFLKMSSRNRIQRAVLFTTCHHQWFSNYVCRVNRGAVFTRLFVCFSAEGSVFSWKKLQTDVSILKYLWHGEELTTSPGCFSHSVTELRSQCSSILNQINKMSLLSNELLLTEYMWEHVRLRIIFLVTFCSNFGQRVWQIY